MTHSLSAPVRTIASAALLLLLPSGVSQAATIFSPVCQTESGGVLFLTQATRACPKSLASCRERFWAYATLQSTGNELKTWAFTPMGTSRLDESAAPEENAKSAQQFFPAPKKDTCAAFFRAALLTSPELDDSTDLFRYSFEGGKLMVHWEANKSVVPFVTRWNVGFCDKDCGTAGMGPIAKQASKLDIFDMPVSTPSFDLRLKDTAILGFPDPKTGNVPSTSLIVSVHLPFLKKTQAFLLYNDALSYSQSARTDLLGGAMITGLLDAALQLDPSNETIRLEYARHLASQGSNKEAIRELKALPPTPGLKKVLTEDTSFDSLRKLPDFQALQKSLP